MLVADEAKQPSIAVAPAGDVYVACIRRGNVVVYASKDGGKTFAGPRMAIDAQGTAKGGRQRGPRIAADGKGRVVVTAFVTFDEAERKKRYPVNDLYGVASSDGGVTWTNPVRLNEVEKKAPESLHSLAVAPDGKIHVAWLDLRERRGEGQDLWWAQYDLASDSGLRTEVNQKVAETVCDCCAPGLALDAKGNPFLAWREGGEKESREVFSIRSTDGGKTFGKPSRVNRAPTKEDT